MTLILPTFISTPPSSSSSNSCVFHPIPAPATGKNIYPLVNLINTSALTTTITSRASSSFSAFNSGRVKRTGKLLHKTTANIGINKENIRTNDNSAQKKEEKESGRSINLEKTLQIELSNLSRPIEKDNEKSTINSKPFKRRFGTIITPNCSKPRIKISPNSSKRKRRKNLVVTGEYTALANRPMLVTPDIHAISV